MKKSNLVIYHAGCIDGFTAAFAASQVLDPEQTEYMPAAYHHAPPHPDDVRGREVYILDFSYPPEVIAGWQAERVVMLDHHKTMAEAWGLPVHREVRTKPMHGVTIHYDPERSGAVMAWDYFKQFATWSLEPPPALFRYVMDRDLWRWDLPFSAEVNAYIATVDRTFGDWAALESRCDHRLDEVRNLGKALLVQQNAMVEEMARNAVRGAYIGIIPIVLVNASVLHSELGHRLIREHGPTTIAVIWHATGTFEAKVSFRSEGDIDVSEIARRFKGGGHRNASGATVPLSTVFSWASPPIE